MEVPGEEMGLRYISKGVLPKRELCCCVSFGVAFFGHLRCRSPKEALTWVGLHKNEDGKGEEGKWMHCPSGLLKRQRIIFQITFLKLHGLFWSSKVWYFNFLILRAQTTSVDFSGYPFSPQRCHKFSSKSQKHLWRWFLAESFGRHSPVGTVLPALYALPATANPPLHPCVSVTVTAHLNHTRCVHGK